jgi:L-ascorbate metabolism protein UlaG (beta-lactamase superfamily)
MADATLTWLGHASFRIDTPGGKRIYVDPFLTGNPNCPESEQTVERADIVALTHGHGDHVGDTGTIAEQHGAVVVAQYELKNWLGTQGVPVGDWPGLGKGGTQEIDGIRFTLTNAFHSSSAEDGSYLGEPCGLVIELENGFTIYFSGDTCVFGDMQLIARLYEPDLAVLPVGGWFTMDPKEAALALELLGVKRCVPSHYGTFPLLTRTPDQLRELAPGVEVHAPEPGGSVDL